jgi:hypothetical protein
MMWSGFLAFGIGSKNFVSTCSRRDGQMGEDDGQKMVQAALYSWCSLSGSGQRVCVELFVGGSLCTVRKRRRLH